MPEFKSFLCIIVETTGCNPDHCGPNTECRISQYGGKPQCICLPGFRPLPTGGCEPDIVQLCIPGPCGINADCIGKKHALK